MPNTTLTAAAALAILAATPARLAALAGELTSSQLRTAPVLRDAWSAIDVLAHLRACADVWGRILV